MGVFADLEKGDDKAPRGGVGLYEEVRSGREVCKGGVGYA